MGHGASPTSKPLHKVSIADYLDDVRSVAGDLGGGPVLIGHSLGGFVIQRYLEERSALAAVWWAPCHRRAYSHWRCESGAADRR